MKKLLKNDYLCRMQVPDTYFRLDVRQIIEEHALEYRSLISLKKGRKNIKSLTIK